jgi:hypothetical protein
MKDYSMGFKNRDIDRFNNKFGKQEDPPKKKMKVSKENSQKVRQAKIDEANKKLADLKSGKGLMAEKERERLRKTIAVHQKAIQRAANN